MQQRHYQLGVRGYLSSDDDVDFLHGSASSLDSLTAEVDLQVDARAAVGYEMDGNYEVMVLYQEENERGGLDWIDSDNLSYFFNQNIYAPDSYYFNGPGPSIAVNNRDINLGSTYSTKRVGTPDHLWVVHDDIQNGECGRTERYITYLVVDGGNYKTGKTPVSELFDNAPVIDSCTGINFQPAFCNTNTVHPGWIEDALRVGIPSPAGTCPQSIDPSCGGTASFDRWQWCPHGDNGFKKTIGTFTYDVHWGYIGINGRYTSWPDNGIFYP